MGIAIFHAEGNCQGPLCPLSMINSNLFYLLSEFTIQHIEMKCFHRNKPFKPVYSDCVLWINMICKVRRWPV